MYCIKCGVKLADTEKECPLCKTVVYHPEFTGTKEDYTYPKGKYPMSDRNPYGYPKLATVVFVLTIVMVLFCDLRFSFTMTWSGYVVGALGLAYMVLVFPFWFQKKNPIVIVDSWFVSVGLYLFYICCVTGGHWFWSFALPILGGVALIVTAVVALMTYTKRGRFFIFGGANIAFGILMPLMEFLLYRTFWGTGFIGWSFYPMMSSILVGSLLIYLGISRSAREVLARKFFI